MEMAQGQKRVLVTGGSRGLGAAICRRLLEEGWQVVTVSRRRSPVIEELEQTFPEGFSWTACDLGDGRALDEFCRTGGVLEGLDGFVANAAIGTDGLLTLLSEEEIRRTIEINLTSTILLTRQVVKGMLNRGQGGSVVFLSSVAAVTGLRGLSVYAATKAALLGFARALAREYGGRGIRFNCVLPGFLETEMTRGLEEGQRARLIRRTPLGRLGEVEDVVGAVVYLLSEEGRFVTGTEVVVDGGLRA